MSDNDRKWLTLTVDRLLYVHRGRETILCSVQPDQGELVVLMNEAARVDLSEQLKSAEQIPR